MRSMANSSILEGSILGKSGMAVPSATALTAMRPNTTQILIPFSMLNCLPRNCQRFCDLVDYGSIWHKIFVEK